MPVDDNVFTLNIIQHHEHVWYQERQEAAAAADNIVFCVQQREQSLGPRQPQVRTGGRPQDRTNSN